MPIYEDNPAGRLHWLLSRYREKLGEPMRDAWANTLLVEPADVFRYLPDIADLVEETREAGAATGQDMFVDLPGYLDGLYPTIFPSDYAIGSAAATDFDPLTIQQLELLSRYLHQHSPDIKKWPDDEGIAGLMETLADLITDIAVADMPEEVRTAILELLTRVMHALEHVHFRGPDAVRLAVIALAGTTAMAEAYVQDKSMVDRLRKFAALVMVVFAAAAPLGSDAIGWENAIQGQLPAPDAQVVVVDAPKPDQPVFPPEIGPGIGTPGVSPSER